MCICICRCIYIYIYIYDSPFLNKACVRRAVLDEWLPPNSSVANLRTFETMSCVCCGFFKKSFTIPVSSCK